MTYPVFEWEEDEEEKQDSRTDVNTAQVYNHSATRLEGEEGLLIDTGSKYNLTGSDFVERQSHQARQHGYDTTWRMLTKPKILAGVGKGQEESTDVATVRGIVQTGDVVEYQAPVLRGAASAVPPLYGLEPMAQRNTYVGTRSGVLHEVPIGKEHLIQWPEGTVHRQCTKARSGHWCLPVSHWKKLKPHTTVTQVFPIQSGKEPSPQPYQ